MPIDQAKELALTAGPFIGMSDLPSLGAQDATRARKLVNMYSAASSVQGDLISRPGYNQVSFAPMAGPGTASASGTSVTGVGSHWTTQVNIGDVITGAGGGYGFVTAVGGDTTLSVGAMVGTFGSGAYTLTPAGCGGAQILGGWHFQLTSGVSHNLMLVSTTIASGFGAYQGGYAFNTFPALRVRLVEWVPTAAFPYGQLIDRTDVSMNLVLLDPASHRTYAVSFANYLIISDGVNRPRKIDSTYTLSNLSDGNYACYGPLTIYYGALFFIDASDQITLRWSEPNAPDTGYGTGTSDNSWSLQQTSADPLQCLIGTNQALFAFRTNSVAIITGASNSDFASSGAVDAVQSIGTRSPDSVLLAGGSVVFLDQYMRPGRIQLGYGYLPLWTRVQETLRGVGKTAALEANAWGRYDATTNLIKFGYRGTGSSTTNEQVVVYDATSFECFGTHVVVSSAGRAAIDHGFNGNNAQSSNPMLDLNGLPVDVILSGTSADPSLYWQSHEDIPANVSQDQLQSGTAVTVQGTVVPPLLGGDPLLEKTWERVVVGTRNVGGSSTGIAKILMQYRTPYYDFTTPKAMLYSGTANPSPLNYDGMTVKVEAKGLNNQPSRWLWCSFQNDVTGNPATRFTFDTVTVVAHAKDNESQRR